MTQALRHIEYLLGLDYYSFEDIEVCYEADVNRPYFQFCEHIMNYNFLYNHLSYKDNSIILNIPFFLDNGVLANCNIIVFSNPNDRNSTLIRVFANVEE